MPKREQSIPWLFDVTLLIDKTNPGAPDYYLNELASHFQPTEAYLDVAKDLTAEDSRRQVTPTMIVLELGRRAAEMAQQTKADFSPDQRHFLMELLGINDPTEQDQLAKQRIWQVAYCISILDEASKRHLTIAEVIELRAREVQQLSGLTGEEFNYS